MSYSTCTNPYQHGTKLTYEKFDKEGILSHMWSVNVYYISSFSTLSLMWYH
jgi:hypothetical protein